MSSRALFEASSQFAPALNNVVSAYPTAGRITDVEDVPAQCKPFVLLDVSLVLSRYGYVQGALSVPYDW